MTPGLTPASLYNDMQGLSRLRGDARQESPEAIRAVAREFEAIFMQMMLKNMRQASLGEGIMDSDQGKFYQEMFDKQIAASLARKEGLGLADIMVRQLTRDRAGARPAEGVGRADGTAPPFPSPAAFIERLKDLARSIGERLGVSPKALLAQSALETGWGQHMIRKADGSNSHNLFGIKADARWNGERAVTSTLEYVDGVAVKELSAFRAYQSYEESFEDYARFLRASPRYEAALRNGGDPVAFARSLQAAGYATDPAYGNKISAILNNSLFDAFDEV
ncbi:MAG TPA: flagellar assembly peptidoglycan hydrolase FlgJ [Chromatiales bacterium]|nr:flagellar assembly peptidoglycan hydrolase FlgJ [Chromatiales bacterium]